MNLNWMYSNLNFDLNLSCKPPQEVASRQHSKLDKLGLTEPLPTERFYCALYQGLFEENLPTFYDLNLVLCNKIEKKADWK